MTRLRNPPESQRVLSRSATPRRRNGARYLQRTRNLAQLPRPVTSAQPSLRGLARILGVSHVALSNAAHRGTLADGIALDGRNRVIVVDAGAAAAEWRRIHVPGHHELMRATPQPTRRAPPTSDPLDTVLPDHHHDRAITAGELFAERDACSLLVTALASVALDGADRDQVGARVAARLRVVAELHGADAAAIAAAEQDLDSTLTMLADDDAEDLAERAVPPLRAVP